MKSEVFGAVAVSVLFSVLSLFRPSKPVKTALGILLISAWLTPLIGAADRLPGEFPAIPEFPWEEPAAFSSGTLEEAFREGIRRTVASEFGLPEEEITVTAEGFDGASLRAEKVTVFLHGKAATADGFAIRRRLTEGGIAGAEVEIALGK